MSEQPPVESESSGAEGLEREVNKTGGRFLSLTPEGVEVAEELWAFHMAITGQSAHPSYQRPQKQNPESPVLKLTPLGVAVAEELWAPYMALTGKQPHPQYT